MESQEYIDVPDSWPLENEESVDTYLATTFLVRLV